MTQECKNLEIKAIIGLGNPGKKYERTRHNIGFVVVDHIAQEQNANWQTKDSYEIAEIQINSKKVLLIKPLTFMNSSGNIIPQLTKKGIAAENILVVQDELEFPFGKIGCKVGGSHKGHNGIRSIINACGANFARLRFGIGRPAQKEDVLTYVLENFSEPQNEIDELVFKSAQLIYSLFEN